MMQQEAVTALAEAIEPHPDYEAVMFQHRGAGEQPIQFLRCRRCKAVKAIDVAVHDDASVDTVDPLPVCGCAQG